MAEGKRTTKFIRGAHALGLGRHLVMGGLLSVAAAVPIVAKAATVTIIGDGALSCGKWISERGADGKPFQVRQAWVFGYLSGMATGVGSDALAPAAVDHASIVVWMDNYCQANPLDPVSKAASALFYELAKRSR
jgi:hypothetical protein